MSAGAVNIRLGAIVTDFLSGFQQAGAAVSKLSSQLNSNLSAGFAAADRQSKVLDRGIGRLSENMQSLGRSLSTYVTLPLAGLAAASLKSAADMEQAGVSFRVLLKDANLAASTINELKAFAASTPFEFNDVQQGAKQLLAYGFAVGDLKTLLTDAGNLASGFGVELGEVTRVLGRIKSGDFGEAFERLRDFGIGRDLLEAKGLKFDKSGQYLGSVQQAFSVIQSIIRERFGGQMEEQSKTLGGIFSNIKDQAAFALSDLGQKLVETFNLKEVGKNFVDFIGKVRDGFNSLPTPIQKAVVVLGAVLAIAGPLTVAFGGLLALIPSITAGWAAITTTFSLSLGPIAAIGAAIAVAAYLIISNWDKIKAALTNSGIWQSLKGLVTSAMEAIKAVFTAAIGFLKAIWDRFGGWLVAFTKTVFEALASVFRFGAGILQGIFTAIAGVFTADWTKVLDGLIILGKSFWNLLIDIFKLGAAAIGRTIAEVFRTLGADSIADKITAGIDKALTKLDSLKGKIQEVGSVTATVAAPATPTGNTPSTKPDAISGLPGSSKTDGKETKTALEEARERLAKLQAKIQDFSFRGIAVPADLLKQYEDLKQRIEQAQLATENFGRVNLGDDAKKIKRDPIKDLTLVEGLANGVPNLPGLTDFQTRTSQQLRDAKLQLKEDQMQFKFSLATIPNLFGSVKDEMQRVAASDPFGFYGVAAKVQDSAKTIAATITSAKENLISGGADLIASFGEGLASGKASFKTLIVGIINLISDAVISIGKALIATGIPLALFPATSALGLKQILTGGAIVLAAGAVKGLASAIPFADGGIVSGPTLGLVGEYAGAKNNPEVIAPLDKLKGMIGGGGQRVEVFGRFELENNTLVAAVEQGYQSDSRFR